MDRVREILAPGRQITPTGGVVGLKGAVLDFGTPCPCMERVKL